jgi:hypothetical protein
MASAETRGRGQTLAATPGEEAAEMALEPLRYNEAPRILLLGDSRCGKTEIARRIVARYTSSCDGIALVGDDKDPRRPQFPGQCYRDPEEINTRPPTPEPRVIVFRGNQDTIQGGNAELYESIARFQWMLARRGRKSLAVYDELDRAARGGQWATNPSAIGWAYGKGGSVGAGSMAGTQETEAVPREVFNQSTCAIVVRMMGNPLRLLKERGYCEGGADKVIPRLPGTELPPQQRGYFVALQRGRPWNQKIYRFATPAR